MGFGWNYDEFQHPSSFYPIGSINGVFFGINFILNGIYCSLVTNWVFCKHLEFLVLLLPNAILCYRKQTNSSELALIVCPQQSNVPKN